MKIDSLIDCLQQMSEAYGNKEISVVTNSVKEGYIHFLEIHGISRSGFEGMTIEADICEDESAEKGKG